MVATYVVAVSAMLFCAFSALTLINTLRHLDPPETLARTRTLIREKVA